MNATAIREGARFAALVLVLVLAAVAGLAVGNLLQGRSITGVGAQAPSAAAHTGTPSYADPHYQVIRRAGGHAASIDAADTSSLKGHAPR